MMRTGNRTVLINKTDLIEKILANKAIHIKEYDEAVVAYKKEALKQLALLIIDVEKGELDVDLNLTTPINNVENYDSIIKMFEWEIRKEVELTQDEFKEYVLDETTFSQNAKMSNTFYSSH